MRRVTLVAWLRRHLHFEPRAASFSFAGGLVGPMAIAGLQLAVAAWADKVVYFTVLIGA